MRERRAHPVRALIRFNQQRTGLLQQYGYKGTVDPTTGMMTNLGVDTSNHAWPAPADAQRE